jgi:flagellar motility protein MotE (MotC chaperone)
VIVTRQRRKPFPWKRFLLPLLAVGLAVFAMTWGPSRNAISNGPMAPLWRSTGSVFGSVAQPFHFAAQNQLLTQRNREIIQLQGQISSLQAQLARKNKQITSLNSQLVQAQTQIAQASSSRVKRASVAANVSANAATQPIAGGTLANANQGNLAANATENMRRTAQYWANMEPENAAKLVQKLPVGYVAEIFALMPPDAVGAILDALPTPVAAKLTAAKP